LIKIKIDETKISEAMEIKDLIYIPSAMPLSHSFLLMTVFHNDVIILTPWIFHVSISYC